MMFRAAFSLIALVAATSMVAAADLPGAAAPIEPPAQPVYVPASAITWSGFYAGISGGYAWGDVDLGARSLRIPGFGTFAAPGGAGFDADGWLLGGTAGYNHQMDRFVLGIEADISYADIGQTAMAAESDLFVPGDRLSADATAELRWLGTLRARAGMAFDRFLVYGTGGLAVGGGRVSAGLSYALPGAPLFEAGETRTNTTVGYAIGGGVEGMIADSLTAKLEYLYADLGVATNAEIDAHIVRAGLNYRFSF